MLLIGRLKSLYFRPANPLDEIIDRLGGPTQVAELTGRSSRIVRNREGVLKIQLRKATDNERLNITERKAFQEGQKLVCR